LRGVRALILPHRDQEGRMVRFALAALPLMLLGACNNKSTIADKVEKNADRRAEAMEQASESMTNALERNAVEQQADIVRSAGKERAEAIRDSDLKASALTKDQQNAIVAGNLVGGTPAPNAR
jgi:hypothetical protein